MPTSTIERDAEVGADAADSLGVRLFGFASCAESDHLFLTFPALRRLPLLAPLVFGFPKCFKGLGRRRPGGRTARLPAPDGAT